MSSPAYIKGDFWRICDECGFKVRSSQTRKRWDGLMVCLADFEERHPQDFVKGVIDRQNVPDPRPEPVDNVIGPLTTTVGQAAIPGAILIYVASTVRFLDNDSIGILLDGGDELRTTVAAVADLDLLQIADPLPLGVSVGNLVTNYSAISTPAL
jgi:hypothetical protein